MMNLKTIAIAALFSVAAPAMVMAQNAPPAAGNAPAISDNDSGNFTKLVEGLGNADFTSATTSLSTATSFKVVKISGMANADSGQLNTAMQPHEQDLAGLRTSIGGNAKAADALKAEGFTADQVVWAQSDSAGSVTLYVSDFPKG